MRHTLVLLTAALVAMSQPAAAQQEWLVRRAQVQACETIRNETLTLVDQWSGQLWRASTDNNREGYLNPNRVIEARQRVQEMIQAYDWRYSARIRSADTVDSTVCRTHALDSAKQIGEFVASILASR